MTQIVTANRLFIHMTKPEEIIKESIKASLAKHGIVEPTAKKKQGVIIKESLGVVIPKTYTLKTESISGETKSVHEVVYKSHVDSFNLVSTKIDTLDKQGDTVNNPNNSEFRRLKLDETENLNGIKFHELYFSNTADSSSEIRIDSLPYMRLSRDWGTFEKWQFDFRACGMAATEGWAVCMFDPFKQKYTNVFVEKNTEGVPVCGIPVLVVDTWHHAWFADHPGDKLEYLNTSMKEVHWSVVEARMLVAEKANLQNLYAIRPIVNNEPEKIIGMLPPTNQPPVQVADPHAVQQTLPDPVEMMPRGAQ